MRKDGRRRSKAGLKFDFSGGEAEKSWTTGNNFLLQEKMPNMPRCHGYWRRIQNCWKNMSRGMPARKHWNRWLQLIFGIWSFSTSGLRRGQRGWRNLQRWLGGRAACPPGRCHQNILFKRYLPRQSWQFYHKYSSGRDKHEVLEEMTSHLGDSSTKATDKGQVGGNWTTHDLITAKSGDVRAHHLHCCCDRRWRCQSLPCRGGRTTFCLSSWFGIRVGQGQF